MIWYSILAYLGETSKLSQFGLIFGNNDFQPERLDTGFKTGASQVIAIVADLYKDTLARHLKNLTPHMGFLQNISFKYVQLRSFILARQCNSLKPSPLSTLKDFILRFLNFRGQVSLLYELFVSESKETSQNIFTIIENRFAGEFTEEECSKACFTAQTQTVNTNSKLLQYKWISRQYYPK